MILVSGKTYGGGEVIFRKGDHADSLFLILEGSVDIVLDGGAKLTELTKGKYFGEMGALTARPRSTTAITHEDGTVLREIPWDKMDECFETNPEIILELMKTGKIMISQENLFDDIMITSCHDKKTSEEND